METVRFFSSSGVPLAADLYVPNAQRPANGYPSIVACLGWGSVKELMSPWGEALAEAGYVVLVPDYRGFGASGGTRGQCFPSEHVEDVRAAITFISQLEESDARRLVVFGVSYGGAIAVAAGGTDDRPHAIVSVVGYGSGERHLQAVRTQQQWIEFTHRLEADRRRRVLTGRSEEIDPDEILLRDDEARAWRTSVESQYPQMSFRTTLESAERIVEFRPEQYLPYSPPRSLLLIHAGDDTMVPVAESELMWERASEPKKLVIIPGIGHHEVHAIDTLRQIVAYIDDWIGDSSDEVIRG